MFDLQLWSHHIDDLFFDLLASIGLSIDLFKMLTSTILSHFYKSFSRAKLDYDSTIYSSASKSQLQKIETFQITRHIIDSVSSTPDVVSTKGTGAV